MAAAGGRRRLIVYLPQPALKPNDGQPQGQQADSGNHYSPAQSYVLLALLSLFFIAFVAWLLYPFCCKKAEEEEQDDDDGRPPRQPDHQVAVDIMESPPSEPPPPLDVCAWKGGTCLVCLAELVEDGGEASLRMLMPCKHLFHTACVDQWLRKSATCPICRAPTLVAKPKPGRQSCRT